MDPLDPALQNTAVSGVKPLLTLAIFAGVGSFFLGALVTAIKRGIKEDGWFKFNQEKEKKNWALLFKVSNLHKISTLLILGKIVGN